MQIVIAICMIPHTTQ